MTDKKKVVIAGFGDTGVLVAVNLAKNFHVVAISSKPCLVSGQELGTRLSWPKQWQKNYLVHFSRYRRLKNCQVIHGKVLAIDETCNSITVQNAKGETYQEPYDVLVLASGVSNGFWRNAKLQNEAAIKQEIQTAARFFEASPVVAVVGGGPTGVSTAFNLKAKYPDKKVHLFYSQQQVLPHYHPKTRQAVTQLLMQQGVQLHDNHRAIITEDTPIDKPGQGVIRFQGEHADFNAGAILWAVGSLKPNNQFIPKTMLNDQGFVAVDHFCRVAGRENIFAIGDIADTDVNRSSARNAGFLVVAHNIRMLLGNKPEKFKIFKAAEYRWGSILGVQKDGMRVFTPSGKNIRIGYWFVNLVLFPYIVGRLIYKGIKPE